MKLLNKMKHSETEIINRYALFLIGLFIASMGVAFSTKAGFGTSPVASVPYSVSLVSKLLSFGGWLNLLSVGASIARPYVGSSAVRKM